MAKILICTFGSYGDLFPFVAVGIELRVRGHAVTIATSAAYQALIESAGLAFHAVRPDMSIADKALIEEFFHPRKGTERVVRAICSYVRESYEDTLPAVARADLVVTHVIAFAAAAAAQKLQRPWVSAVLAPSSFLSVYDPLVPAPSPWIIKLRPFGPGVFRLIYRLARAETLRWMEELVRFRREIGLPDGAHPLFEGAYAKELVLALFSRYLTPRPADWPAQAVVTGFPFYDQAEELPAELERFLAAGSPPVVFTLGSSAVGAAGSFYQDSVEAVRQLGQRAVLLTGPQAENVPAELPANILAVPYAPHARVFPRASVIVHQGGIGTTAQALRSGRPALVVPFSHDQFDNAERVKRLGTAKVIYRSRYNAKRARRAIGELLANPAYAQAAAGAGERVRGENGPVTAADAIEARLARLH